MVRLVNEGVFIRNGEETADRQTLGELDTRAMNNARRSTMAYGILSAHNTGKKPFGSQMIKFDALASHDITYVGIIQTARASGLTEFPVPYILTNCHNSLCAVGGTINEDDHMFGLSAARKYGGIYVPPHQAVIHSFMRETQSGCGKMILGSDSHTRYGAFGTMAIGEGGPELVKQLLGRTYDVEYPPVVAVRLTGTVRPGVGPQDVAIALIGATFGNGFVKNCVLEFIGDGIEGLSMDFRAGIDVMTTETACLSSIWMTDEKTRAYFKLHGRPEAYRKLRPGKLAYYDKMVEIDLSSVEPMIALPFHPSNAYTIREFTANAADILREVEKRGQQQLGLPDGRFRLTEKAEKSGVRADQGVIAGCAGGTFENIMAAADILRGRGVGSEDFTLSLYPASQPVLTEVTRNGAAADLLRAGGVIRTAFCGPCFGAGDVPANNALSIRHSTRNFPNREGSKPGEGQIASVALMDARSIAATALTGYITPADSLDPDTIKQYKYRYDDSAYKNRVYNGYRKADNKEELKLGPNITDWPAMPALADDILLGVAAVINDPVTTTDELIPSGESSSYRSNPVRLSKLTLSRRCPQYVGKAGKIAAVEADRAAGRENEKLSAVTAALAAAGVKTDIAKTGIGSVIYAKKPGDGSAREQAASCQKVLGGFANIAVEYATKRYRSNLINWGMIPFTFAGEIPFAEDDFVFVPGVRKAIADKKSETAAYAVKADGSVAKITLGIGAMTDDERRIILDGCLINYYREQNRKEEK